MDIYLVGGAVRDALLDRPVKERDWVVVGAKPDTLVNAGYKPVGKSFPVFLHPDTKEEYALARTERKVSAGYHGFEFDTSDQVTLEEDLIRRDLTINAIAQTDDGTLIDPYGGQADLENRVLRHLSPAFAEDPLRVLRVARFAARYHDLGFRIADETLELMHHLSESGELDTLTAERVWKELQLSLVEQHPEVFVQVLHQCGALGVLLPELEHLFARSESAPSDDDAPDELVDASTFTLLALKAAVSLSDSPVIRYAVLCHDMGLARVDEEDARDLETLKAEQVEALSRRLKAPREYRDLAVLTAKYHCRAHQALSLKPKKILKLIGALDGLRKSERFGQFLVACKADQQGRPGYESHPYHQADFLLEALKVVKNVDIRSLREQGFKGREMKEAIHDAQLEALRAFCKASPWRAQGIEITEHD